jgi:hypothetical protein
MGNKSLINDARSKEFWEMPGPVETEVVEEEGEKRETLWAGGIDILIEAKERDDGVRPSVIDIDAFKEMLELHEFILQIEMLTP